MASNKRRRNRPAPYIKLIFDAKRAAGDALDLLGTELRDDQSPLGNGRRTDIQSPGDIRSRLKVINNVSFEHEPDLTLVHSELQPQYQIAMLTLVDMELLTQSDRLGDAMKVARVSRSDLARECGVSAAAVTKWLKGGKMNADSLAKAARAVGVRDEWLRTGKLPRDREHAQEERDIDRIIVLLSNVLAPLTSLVTAIEQITKGHGSDRKRTGS